MQLANFINHIDRLKRFYNSDLYYEFNNADEGIINNLVSGYISAISNDIFPAHVLDKYSYPPDIRDWFFIEYIVEDYLTYGYALIPNIKDTFLTPPPHSVYESLDQNHGIRICNDTELYEFITIGKLPEGRDIEYIPRNFAIRRNQEN